MSGAKMAVVLMEKHVIGAAYAIGRDLAAPPPGAAPALPPVLLLAAGVAAPGPSGPDLADLVGTALPLTTQGGQLIQLPASWLAAKMVDLDLDLLRGPLDYEAASGSPTLQPPLEVDKVSVSAGAATVTLSAAAPAQIDLIVAVAAPDGTASKGAGQIPAGQTSGNVTLLLPSGSGPFAVLVLAPSYAAWLGATS